MEVKEGLIVVIGLKASIWCLGVSSIGTAVVAEVTVDLNRSELGYSYK